MTRSMLPLAPGTDWSHIDYTDEYVAIMELPMSETWRYVAIRGGRTIGHWTKPDAETAGRRLQDEVAGRYCGTLMVNVWLAWANPVCALRNPLTVSEFFYYALPTEDARRTDAQYKADPLVAGPATTEV